MSLPIEALQGPWTWATSVQYSQAVRVGDMVFTGGIGGFDPDGNLVPGGFEAQVRQTMTNLAQVLEAFGTSLANVASMTVFVQHPADYELFKGIRPDYLEFPYPASTAVGAGQLLVEGMLFEMNAIAVMDGERQALNDM